jgi:hypothetical protein
MALVVFWKPFRLRDYYIRPNVHVLQPL